MEEKLGKRELNKARRRCAIVETATRAFLEKGFGDTSMSAIADELGGSKATLWSHFGCKDDLFIAVIESQVQIFGEQVDDVLTGQTFTLPALRRLCLRLIDLLLRENSIQLFRLVLSERDRHPSMAEAFYVRGPVKLRKAVTEFFATCFDAEQSHLLTQLTMSAVLGFRSDALVRPDMPTTDDREAFVDNLIEHLRLPDYTHCAQ